MRLWVLALAAALVVVAGGAGLAKEPSNIGVVDYEKVLAGYTEYQAAAQKMQAFVAERQARLSQKVQTRLLVEAELTEYDALSKLAAPTDENKKRLTELLAASDQREQELDTLQATATRTPEQEKRLQELRGAVDASQKALTALQGQLEKEIADEKTRVTKPMQDKLDKTYAAVATEMKLAVIINKGDVLYGGEDITDKVLARLNKP